MSVGKLYIPENVLDVDPDSTAVGHIANELQKLPFDPAMGVYTGVEGEDFIKGQHLPQLEQTFGNDYTSLLSGAKARDTDAITDVNYALTYARQASIPAVLVYDGTQLDRKDTHLWTPRIGRLQDAARAIIFFSGLEK